MTMVDNGPTIKSKLKQTFLDLGQNGFSAKECDICGMVYAPGVSSDEGDHLKYHASFLRTEAKLLTLNVRD